MPHFCTALQANAFKHHAKLYKPSKNPNSRAMWVPKRTKVRNLPEARHQY